MGYATIKLPLLKYEPIDVTTKPIDLSSSILSLNSWKPKQEFSIKIPDPALTFTDLFQKYDIKLLLSDQLTKPLNNGKDYISSLKSLGASLGSTFISAGVNLITDKLFDTDNELGRSLGTLFSSGVSSTTNSITNNILKGTSLMDGLGKDVGSSLAGTGAGIAGNLIGKGINSLGGDSMLSRGLGLGVSTAIGGFGGLVLSNLVKGNAVLQGFNGITKAGLTAIGAKATADAINAGKSTIEAMKAGQTAANAAKFASWANIGGLAGTAVGMGLQAAFGPSKEYGGKYGNITLTADTIYDIALTGISFAGPVGAIIGGGMALNKGLSNIFGSTDGMTVQDSILGSAWMPVPVKWLNMWGSSKTGDFYNLSWQNSEKANSFMGNAFGDLGDRFQRAREEANKTYGTFSHGAKKEAQNNIDFANSAWGKILAMADLNEYQNIRSQYMSSINNLRYAQNIQGGWTPLYRGKQGMKIFNNATNHNMGMRLLSTAALIDNKQMILSALTGTKFSYSEEKLDDWFPDYKNTASTFGNMMKNLSAYFLKHNPDYKISKYKPTTSSNKNVVYYTIPNLKYDVVRNLSREYLTGKPLTTFEEVFNDNKFGNLRETGAVNLGKYKVSVGQDENGRYISFYDKYDWNILESVGLGGLPFEIYDRIYEKEWPTLYNNSKK